MSEAKHTPGPWKMSPSVPGYPFESQVWDAKGRALLFFADGIATGEEANANARLIAAAPDLLAALEAVAADYGITLQPVPCELTGSDLHSTAIRLLRAAYAKATQPGA